MKKHILLVDDEAYIRELLTQVLERKGYRVSAVGGAHEARRIAEEDPPQLIVSDLQMEDTDGLELVAQIKDSLPNVPVMLLTGVVFDAEVIRENIATKVSCYLPKTAPLNQVLREVRRLLGEPAEGAS